MVEDMAVAVDTGGNSYFLSFFTIFALHFGISSFGRASREAGK